MKPRTHGADTEDDAESKKRVLSAKFGYLVISNVRPGIEIFLPDSGALPSAPKKAPA